ncbi:MAG: C-3',4' desaturase CrtD, partial [Okeania sp. SIO2D1]|nr:C-3',4' desaturase CrtD [Okeania sp. SIO2D1]
VTVRSLKTGEVWQEAADEVVANVTVQNLLKLLGEDTNPKYPKSLKQIVNRPTSLLGMKNYQDRAQKLSYPSGAFVIYLGVKQQAIPDKCPPHLQFLYDYQGPIGENNSLFVSVSKPGDGRAPQGQATIIASSFVEAAKWWCVSEEDYQGLKQEYTQEAIARLNSYFHLTRENIIHQEAATPRTFAHFTARENGIVGGIGQRISTFGPFGFATRTPIEHLWLVGDSVHPGEGTAGVSYSALTVARQISGNLAKL